MPKEDNDDDDPSGRTSVTDDDGSSASFAVALSSPAAVPQQEQMKVLTKAKQLLSQQEDEDHSSTSVNDSSSSLSINLPPSDDSSSDSLLEQQVTCQSSWSFQRASTPLEDKQITKTISYLDRKLNAFYSSPPFQALQQQEQENSAVCGCSQSTVELGGLVGRGAFSNVFFVRQLNCHHTTTIISKEDVVVKVLRPQLLDKPSLFRACALGLLREGAILSQLNHTHVIALQAICGNYENYQTGCNDGCFLVLSKLNDGLLDDRIEERWKPQRRRLRWMVPSSLLLPFRRNNAYPQSQPQQLLLLEQLSVARDLAAAVAYLHSKRVLHRDLKPANVGFVLDKHSKNSVLQLFDFDVATVLSPLSSCSNNDNDDDTYKLTAKIGTRRYMSPECGLGEPYGLKSDVFSFGILWHQILSLQTPFERTCQTRKEHARRVFVCGERPVISKRQEHEWGTPVCDMMRLAWKRQVHPRPTMDQLHDLLEERVQQQERICGMNDQSKEVGGTNASASSRVSVLPPSQ